MKKSVQHTTKQLRLTSETLRRLTSSELRGAAGGDVTSTVKEHSKLIPCTPVP